MEWEKFDRKIKRIKAVSDWSEHTAITSESYVKSRARKFRHTVNKQIAEALKQKAQANEMRPL